MAFAFRSYFAIPHLRTKDGRPTNAVFGFARALLRILHEQKPTHIAVVFDAPGKTFRDELYADYKAHRPDTPDDLIAQFPVIDELVKAFPLPLLRVPEVEADDVLASLARRAAADGIEAVVCSGDKDMLQIVGDGIRVYDPYKGGTGAWYGPAEVLERYGVPPARVVDAMALIGDTADNVPGVRGIGEKTAKKLLEQYETLEGLYAHLDALKGKQRENIENGRADAFLSRDLVTLKTDLALDVAFDSLRVPDLDRPALEAFFRDHEFHSLTEEFMPDATETEELDYRLVLTMEELDAAIAEMRAAGSFAIDTESTSTEPTRAALVGISLSCKACTGYYIPVGHLPEAMVIGRDPEELFGGEPVTGLEKAAVLERLRPLLEDASIGKIGHNIKYDMVLLAREGVTVQGVSMDTMLASYLTDPSQVRHNLGEVSAHYLRRRLIPISDLIGKGAKATTFDTVPVDRACAYACEDADIAWRLAAHFSPFLEERGLVPLMDEVETPLIGVLARMELAGIAIDNAVFAGLQQEIEGRLAALRDQIHDLAGGPFQINSPKQLQDILFGKLGLKPIRKTKTGFSTDMEVLEQLAVEHPLPERILAYRTLEKLRGTYVEALPKLVHPDTGRIHTSFNQTIAATGRLSSSNPNLQNIPIRTAEGRRIRQGFVPGRKGDKLISADYSQIELRVLAHLSGDEAMLAAFRDDRDIHTETAARIFGVPAEQVDAAMRRQAKAVNFGVVYGQSGFGLAKALGISNAEATRFITQYFEQFPGVQAWQEMVLSQARETGFVTTLMNRRRYLPELQAGDANTRRQGERVAINTPVQGSAADIIKVAMVKLDERLRGTKARMLLQVHDELLVEAPADEAEAVAAMLVEVMQHAVSLRVTLKVEAGTGANWDEIH